MTRWQRRSVDTRGTRKHTGERKGEVVVVVGVGRGGGSLGAQRGVR